MTRNLMVYISKILNLRIESFCTCYIFIRSGLSKDNDWQFKNIPSDSENIPISRKPRSEIIPLPATISGACQSPSVAFASNHIWCLPATIFGCWELIYFFSQFDLTKTKKQIENERRFIFFSLRAVFSPRLKNCFLSIFFELVGVKG